MAVTTSNDLVSYYAGLLIKQYAGKLRAVSHVRAMAAMAILPQTTVQTVTFSALAASGGFTLYYGATQTASILWNDSTATVQAKIAAIAGLSGVTVTGSISGELLTFTFAGVPSPAAVLTVGANTLLDPSSNAIAIAVAQTDQTLPLAVMNAFNLVGPNTAVGKQLDTLGKYAGVTRTGQGTLRSITLSDSDFLSLIRIAIISNTSSSDLGTIQSLLNTYFPGQIFVFDYGTMRLSYFIASTVGTQDLLQVLIYQKLLPKPMGVQLSVVSAPIINTFFGFRTYTKAGVNNSPFNNYTSYNTAYPWLSDAYAVTVPST